MWLDMLLVEALVIIIILSACLFTRYIRPLLTVISSSNVGCHIGGIAVNIFAYAVREAANKQQLLKTSVEQTSYVSYDSRLRVTILVI